MDLRTDNLLKIGDLVMIDALSAVKQDPLFDGKRALRSFHKSIGEIDCISADHDQNIEYDIQLIDHPSGSVVLKKVPRCWLKKNEKCECQIGRNSDDKTGICNNYKWNVRYGLY